MLAKKINIENYIGIPFENKGYGFNGCDCFSLVRLFYKNEFNYDIPDPLQTALDIKGVFDRYIEETAKNWITVTNPKLYDVVAIADDRRMPDIIQHFGILLENGKMLHTKGNVGSHIVSIDSYKHYIKGYHRWQNS